MIQKIFAKNTKKSAIWVASLGTVIGLSLLFLSIQLYLDVRTMSAQENNIIQNDYIVVKKKVSELSSFGINNNCFSNQELEELSAQNFVKSMAVFQGCRYKVFVQLSQNGGAFPEFSTLAYFESIPDKYIDVETQNWNWEEKDSIVPLILPSTYIDAYNFGIALSMGTPQLSKKLLSTVPFKLKIEGDQKKKTYYSKVIGFSDRINSILVPDSFLKYTNTIYGNTNTNPNGKIIIETINAKSQRIKDFLTQNNYQTNLELIKVNKVQEILKDGLVYQLCISLIIIVQSVLLFLFYSKILISKSSYEIKTLIILGYSVNTISKTLSSLTTKFYVCMVGLSFIIALISKNYINYWLINQKQIELQNGLSVVTLLIGLIFSILFIGINTISTKKRITELAG